MHATKVAISLPQELLTAVEDARRRRGETRSQFFRRAAEALISAESEDERDRRYILAYRQIPETVDEGLYAAGLQALAQEPWEESSG